MTKQPMQPVLFDEHGVPRFQKNAIVIRLLDVASACGYDLNSIARQQFSKEDQMQLAQLIGYSVSGLGELDYSTEEMMIRADEASHRLKKFGATPRAKAIANSIKRLRTLHEEASEIQRGDSDFLRSINWQAEFVIACFEELPHLFEAVEGI